MIHSCNEYSFLTYHVLGMITDIKDGAKNNMDLPCPAGDR